MHWNNSYWSLRLSQHRQAGVRTKSLQRCYTPLPVVQLLFVQFITIPFFIWLLQPQISAPIRGQTTWVISAVVWHDRINSFETMVSAVVFYRRVADVACCCIRSLVRSIQLSRESPPPDLSSPVCSSLSTMSTAPARISQTVVLVLNTAFSTSIHVPSSWSTKPAEGNISNWLLKASYVIYLWFILHIEIGLPVIHLDLQVFMQQEIPSHQRKKDQNGSRKQSRMPTSFIHNMRA